MILSLPFLCGCFLLLLPSCSGKDCQHPVESVGTLTILGSCHLSKKLSVLFLCVSVNMLGCLQVLPEEGAGYASPSLSPCSSARQCLSLNLELGSLLCWESANPWSLLSPLPPSWFHRCLSAELPVTCTGV